MKINCQAFLEIKKILSIKKLDAAIDDFAYSENDKEIKGNILVTTQCYIDNLENITETKDSVPFNVVFVNNDSIQPKFDLSIENLVYHTVEGRGIELEFDIDIIETKVLEDDIVPIPVEIIDNGDNIDTMNDKTDENKPCDNTQREAEVENIDNETLKDQVVENVDNLLQSKLELVEDNFPDNEQSILTPSKRKYTHLKIKFKNNNGQ